ncbi:MAG: glycosyltransferase family 1 protein [Chloroflexota bacterium]
MPRRPQHSQCRPDRTPSTVGRAWASRHATFLYPAQTWPHKNHANLLRALARLREAKGLEIPLVASGRRNEHFPVLEELSHSLDLTHQVVWTDFVSEADLLALYGGATAVVIPTRFEAASAPLWEAFHAGIPAACSNVTSLPEQAGDAALLFDPDDVPGMAESIERLWTDAALRAVLIARGSARVSRLSWDRTARIFRAHYRRIAGRQLSEQDEALVAPTAGF